MSFSMQEYLRLVGGDNRRTLKTARIHQHLPTTTPLQLSIRHTLQIHIFFFQSGQVTLSGVKQQTSTPRKVRQEDGTTWQAPPHEIRLCPPPSHGYASGTLRCTCRAGFRAQPRACKNCSSTPHSLHTRARSVPHVHWVHLDVSNFVHTIRQHTRRTTAHTPPLRAHINGVQ